MTSICITPSFDCKLAPKCERHFQHHPDKIDPDQSYQVNLGDTAVIACPSFRELIPEPQSRATSLPKVSR